MKNFNISAQSKSVDDIRQAIKKEYVYRLYNQTNSLYHYLHYYNPEWRILGANADNSKRLSYYNEKSDLITENDLLSDGGEKTFINIFKLHYRWGLKNRSTKLYFFGGATPEQCTSTLNIGATLYKKDAYDVDSNTTDILDHFLVFESGLAQYFTWKIRTGRKTPTDNNLYLIYDFYLSNELDFGLTYQTQIVQGVPRYFYQSGSNFDCNIHYNNQGFDIGTLFDYNNYNVKYSTDNINWTPSETPNPNVYQQWSGATDVIADVILKTTTNDNRVIYEDIIAEVSYYQRPGKNSSYTTRFNKATSEAEEIEENFRVIYS